MTELEAANFLALSIKTLQRWRWLGQGPSYHKLGNAVRYASQDLEAFLVGCRHANQQKAARPTT
jgi:hypothetical protein